MIFELAAVFDLEGDFFGFATFGRDKENIYLAELAEEREQTFRVFDQRQAIGNNILVFWFGRDESEGQLAALRAIRLVPIVNAMNHAFEFGIKSFTLVLHRNEKSHALKFPAILDQRLASCF